MYYWKTEAVSFFPAVCARFPKVFVWTTDLLAAENSSRVKTMVSLDEEQSPQPLSSCL